MLLDRRILGVHALNMVKAKIVQNALSKESIADGSECMAFNLKKATRSVQTLFDNAFKPIGLKGTQYTVLSHIYIAGPVTLKKLADLMSVDRTTLGRNLKPLEKKAFITIRPCDDRRAKSIFITNQGKKVLSKAHPIWKETHLQIKRLLGHKNFDLTIKNLRDLTYKTQNRQEI